MCVYVCGTCVCRYFEAPLHNVTVLRALFGITVRFYDYCLVALTTNHHQPPSPSVAIVRTMLDKRAKLVGYWQDCVGYTQIKTHEKKEKRRRKKKTKTKLLWIFLLLLLVHFIAVASHCCCCYLDSHCNFSVVGSYELGHTKNSFVKF